MNGDGIDVDPMVREENLDGLFQDAQHDLASDMSVEDIELPDIKKGRHHAVEIFKNTMNFMRIERDMTKHAPNRTRFITDQDIWESLYSDNILFKYHIVLTEQNDDINLTTSSYFKANSLFFYNDGKTKLRIGMITGTKNMTSIACGMAQVSHNFTRRLQGSIGLVVGSLESLNLGVQYKPTNTTSLKYKLNTILSNPERTLFEHTVTVREQLTEDFSMQIEFINGKHNELKLSAKQNLNILSTQDNSTSIEVEAKFKAAIANGTVRLRNQIGENYATQLEVNAGTSGSIPMLTFSADVLINLSQVESLFNKEGDVAVQNSSSMIKNINAIFGVGYGFDGLTFNVGFSLAGITVKLPILFSNDLPETELSQEERIADSILWGGVLLFFFSTTYALKRLVQKRRERKEKQQEENEQQEAEPEIDFDNIPEHDFEWD